MAESMEYLHRARPVSKRYEAYEKRIQRVNRVLSWFRNHKILSCFILAAIVGIVLGLLMLQGTFIGDFRCGDHVYGEEPHVSCLAFLYRPRYEYSAASQDPVWSEDTPVLPGNYQVRAYTKNAFGNIRYTEVLTFVIHPRNLSIEVESGDYIYGDMSQEYIVSKTKVTGLAEGDKISDVRYSVSENEDHHFSVSVTNYRILSSSGDDVSRCYEVTVSEGAFTMKPRPVTVMTADAEKIYDGKNWHGAAVTISDGSLAGTDEMIATVDTLPADVGTYEITAQVQMLDENGVDVTQCYDLTFAFGTLTVKPIVISLLSGNASKTYDEKPLTNAQWSVVSGNTVAGHALEVSVTGSQTAAGKSDNFIRAAVFDADGNDVSGNYSFDIVCGTLTVEPIVLKVKSESAQKVYDGNVLSAGGKLVEGTVLKGHKISISKQYEVVNVGSYKNIPEVVITNKQGVDVTAEGYKIEFDYGMLVITPRPITVASESATKLYDGYPLICHEFSLTDGTLGKQGGRETISSAVFPASQTEVGSCPNTFTVFIYSSSGFETTMNYEITYEYGTLTVLENPNAPEQDTPMTDVSLGGSTLISFPDDADSDDGVYAYISGLDGLLSKTLVYLRTESYGEYNTIGWQSSNRWKYNNTYNSTLTEIGRVLDGIGNARASIRIQREKGCPVIMPYFTSNGNLVYDDGNDCYFASCPKEFEVEFHAGLTYEDIKDMQLTPTDPALEKLYRQFVYDEYLKVPASTSKALLQWAESKGIYADSPTLVQDIQRKVLNAAIYNEDAENYPKDVDVVVYFLTEAREGICQHFASAATLLYRCFGIPARYTVGFVTEVRNGEVTELVSDNAHAWVEIYVDGSGWVPIEVTPGGGFGSGIGGGSLTITGYSAVKYYDGQPFDLSGINAYTVEDGFIRSGHRLEVTFKNISKYVEPGEYKLEIKKYTIYDEQGNDVTDQYDEITIKPGTLTILKRRITITTGSASKQYDGLPLSCLEYWISQGSLVPGDALSVELLAAITDPGRIDNKIEKLKIIDTGYKKPRDVTDFYDITVITGFLEVTAAP